MYKFLTAFQQLQKAPSIRSAKWCDIPALMLVEPTGEYETEVVYGDGIIFDEVEYQTSTKRFKGWIPSRFLEDFVEPFPNVVKIKNATLNPNDANQYVVGTGENVWYNLCGELCVCYCAKWEYDLEDWLLEWKSKPLSFYNRIFYGGKSATTGLPDLDNMLNSFQGYQVPSVRLGDALFEPLLGRPLFTPRRLSKLLVGNRIIVSCKIETRFGRLRDTGVLHWVVIEDVASNRFGGSVSIYNPFPNTHETYPWDVFIKSVGAPFGILVER